MPQSHGMASSASARLEALQKKHKNLSRKIDSEQNHFFLDDQEIKMLKLEKLRVKEQIEGLRDVS